MLTSRLFVFVLFLSFLTPTAQALTLDQAYLAATQNTAIVRDRKWGEEIAQQQKDQATASVLPKVAVLSTNTWRDPVPGVGPFGEGYQHFGTVNLTQPLFQGGAEYYALKNAQKLPEIAKYQREQEELSLYTLVAQAFFQVARLEKDLITFKEQKQTLRDQVKTLQRRADIGRSKQTEVIASRSQLARVTAELSRIEQQIIAAKKSLMNLTGLSEEPTLEDSSQTKELTLVDSWAEAALDTPIIKANQLLVENARREISAARGSLLPTLNLDGNYYLDRAGILKDSTWDVTVNARWEFFSGGNDLSEIRIKKIQAIQLENQLTDLKRNTENDFKALKKQFYVHQKIAQEMAEAVELAEQNYKKHIQEANQGLVSDLDVLRALDDYLVIRRSHDQQHYDLKLTWVQLRALAGEHP